MAGGFSFDFTGFKTLGRDLGRIAKNVQANEARAVRRAGEAYRADVVPLAPIDTGQYRAGIRVEMSTEFGAPVALIGSPAPQARQLEYGGIIRVKNAPYLVFKTKDGNWVQTKEVYQPPHPHWRPAWDNNLARYQTILLNELDGGRK